MHFSPGTHARGVWHRACRRQQVAARGRRFGVCGSGCRVAAGSKRIAGPRNRSAATWQKPSATTPRLQIPLHSPARVPEAVLQASAAAASSSPEGRPGDRPHLTSSPGVCKAGKAGTSATGRRHPPSLESAARCPAATGVHTGCQSSSCRRCWPCGRPREAPTRAESQVEHPQDHKPCGMPPASLRCPRRARARAATRDPNSKKMSPSANHGALPNPKSLQTSRTPAGSSRRSASGQSAT
mmetsp:Transcript_133677/g.337695  ORF Transcript_133677/g.337695 Transcript_133677/m.337695 type:complete len:240 (-) Transcript_133677:57-776(-)